MKNKIFVLSHIFISIIQSSNYTIEKNLFLYTTNNQTANIGNVFFENKIIIDNLLCNPNDQYNNLIFYIENLPIIDNPSYFISIDLNNKLNIVTEITNTYNDVKNNTLAVNTIQTSSIESALNTLQFNSDSIYLGNTKNTLTFNGNINIPNLYTNKIDIPIRSIADIKFSKSIDTSINSKLNITDFQASNIIIQPLNSKYLNQVIFMGPMTLNANNIQFCSNNIFNDNLIINSNNIYIIANEATSNITKYLILNSNNNLCYTDKKIDKSINYYTDTVLPTGTDQGCVCYIYPKKNTITINSENEIYFPYLWLDNTVKLTCNNFVTKNMHLPDCTMNIDESLYINCILLNQNPSNNTTLYFQEATTSINHITNKNTASKNPNFSYINSNCIFNNLNITNYSIGYLNWENNAEYKILHWNTWKTQINKDMLNIIKYISYKYKYDTEFKILYYENLIQEISSLLSFIKNNIQDHLHLKSLLYEILKEN